MTEADVSPDSGSEPDSSLGMQPEVDVALKQRSSKPALIWAVAVLSGLGLLSSVQVWLDLEFAVGAATVDGLSVTGQQVNPALTLIALASLAAALVLMIAGKKFRRVIGVLVTLLGAGLATLAITTMTSPLERTGGLVSGATGIAGDAQADLVSSVGLSLWPTATAVVGVLLAVVGVLITVLSGRWKVAGRKYDTGTDGVKARPKTDATATGDRISDWDALSDGDDPTE